MTNLHFTQSRARLRIWLACVYALFIIYASLSPFTGWRDQGLNFLEVLTQPLLDNSTMFDSTLNLLAYLPLGLLLGLALRVRMGPLPSLLIASLLGTVLSGCMEYLQMYLPMRSSSNMDILTNSIGATTGALLAISITAWTRLYQRMTGWRDYTFLHGTRMDFGLALLALWMFGQVNPSLPMLGNVFISQVTPQPFENLASVPFNFWESAAVMLNLLMLGSLLLTILRNPETIINALLLVLSCVALVKFINAVVLLKSYAMLLWVNSEAVLGILLGSVILLGSRTLSPHTVVRLGVLETILYIFIAHAVLNSGTPAAAMSIYHWHYGHLLNYNGLAQTITMFFPALLLFHLWRVRKV